MVWGKYHDPPSRAGYFLGGESLAKTEIQSYGHGDHQLLGLFGWDVDPQKRCHTIGLVYVS